jgi:hypothetical protein
MAGTQSSTDEYAEAVIISGPRKGEFITIPERELILTEAEATMLDTMVTDAGRLAETAREAAAEADALLSELRQARVPRDEPAGTPGRTGKNPARGRSRASSSSRRAE